MVVHSIIAQLLGSRMHTVTWTRERFPVQVARSHISLFWLSASAWLCLAFCITDFRQRPSTPYASSLTSHWTLHNHTISVLITACLLLSYALGR
ncbi:hypothetical protein BU25DRAFT_202243 [Macroventuria anomochaeta]|uniref:Uncharacterized protein n=1 Tax=Macroventuria anomochaeta TaxID=301207 RepID=A0ACB6RLR7_9PLEO|nr:uncharacterized protein BU25DRAFT_202243 [Macroventuria anomochaeta]KAF2622856.1 hypothetical protein BU25DRAFT_202243 [Macroventuria anomochaeta]